MLLIKVETEVNSVFSIASVESHAIIPALARLKQEDHKFQGSVGYRARGCLHCKKKLCLFSMFLVGEWDSP
jgi:hypothetical protein